MTFTLTAFALTTQLLIDVERQRQPQLGLVGQAKAGWHDADDGAALSAYRQRPP
jgi:hypothetical protein